MSDVKRFRFVSPGIFINEIDQSQIPALPARMGPVVIGRASKGPGFRPTVCHSFAEFVEIFGRPLPGKADNDIWRDGNTTGPTYGAYAAQAYLKHSNPVTFVRVLGSQHPNHSSTTQGHEAGWKTNTRHSNNGGAYGLFVINSGSAGNTATATLTFSDKPNETTIITLTDADGTSKTFEVDNEGDGVTAGRVALNGIAAAGGGATGTAADLVAKVNAQTIGITATNPAAGEVLLTMDAAGTAGNKDITTTFNNATVATAFTGGANAAASLTGTLAAVWYLNEGTIELSGTQRGTEASPTSISGSAVLIGNVDTKEWKAVIKNSSGVIQKEASFNFNPNSDKYIRSVFNTNPTLVNSDIHTSTKNYWLLSLIHI